MITNSVSPFEGALVWVGTPSSGTSQTSGQPWKVVDFAIKYTDHKMQELFMVLTASGLERVDKLLTLPLGTMLRVDFQITARKSDYNGQEKWWGSLSVYRITPVVVQQAQPTQPQPQSQQQGQWPQWAPQQPTQMPQTAPYQQPVLQAPTPIENQEDLPF